MRDFHDMIIAKRFCRCGAEIGREYMGGGWTRTDHKCSEKPSEWVIKSIEMEAKPNGKSK